MRPRNDPAKCRRFCTATISSRSWCRPRSSWTRGPRRLGGRRRKRCAAPRTTARERGLPVRIKSAAARITSSLSSANWRCIRTRRTPESRRRQEMSVRRLSVAIRSIDSPSEAARRRCSCSTRAAGTMGAANSDSDGTRSMGRGSRSWRGSIAGSKSIRSNSSTAFRISERISPSAASPQGPCHSTGHWANGSGSALFSRMIPTCI